MIRYCLIVAVLLSGCVARERGVEPAHGGGHDVELAAGWQVSTGRIAPRATLAALLRSHGISEGDVAAAIAQAASRFDLRKVRAAQPYRITTAVDGALRSLDYEIDADRALHVRREPGGDLAADVTAIAKSRRRVVVRGTIDRASPSLFAAMDAAGESIDLSIALADIFAGEIDFSTELQPGDRFEVVVEKQVPRPREHLCGVRADSRGAVRQRGPARPRLPLYARRQRGRLLRRARRVDAPVLSQVAVEVRAGRDVRVFAQPISSYPA